jgi:hypothetical protein
MHASGKTAGLVSAVEICKFLVEQEKEWEWEWEWGLDASYRTRVKNGYAIHMRYFTVKFAKIFCCESWKSEPTSTTLCTAIYIKYARSLVDVYPF